jgi:hypothetical protein
MIRLSRLASAGASAAAPTPAGAARQHKPESPLLLVGDGQSGSCGLLVNDSRIQLVTALHVALRRSGRAAQWGEDQRMLKTCGWKQKVAQSTDGALKSYTVSCCRLALHG